MEANELMIGNWVLDSDRDDPNFYEVVRVESMEYTDWNSGDDFSVSAKIEGLECSYFDIRPSPIPITEDWLIKFGFESNPYQDRYEIGEFEIECDKTSGVTELWMKGFPHIKYIHQIQNFYFIGTGKELKI